MNHVNDFVSYKLSCGHTKRLLRGRETTYMYGVSCDTCSEQADTYVYSKIIGTTEKQGSSMSNKAKSTSEMILEEAENKVSNEVYKATAIFERLEHEGKIRGNGHHIRQEIAGYAVRIMQKRWRQ